MRIGWKFHSMTRKTVRAAIGIGSNIQNPVANVQEAFGRLSEIGKLVSQSSLYVTKPWGVLDQPDFINACAIIEVNCTPQELLAQLLALELSMGRDRKSSPHWGPRIIDLDILTFGDACVDEPNLTIPHKHMLERAFVLAPLAEIDTSYEPALKALPEAARAEVTPVERCLP